MKDFDKITIALGLLFLAAVGGNFWLACTTIGAPAVDKRITFVAPTPAPVEIFWIDTAGNMGLRGVVAIVPGLPSDDPKALKLTDACRASATANGDGTLTICMVPSVGQTLAAQLGLGRPP